MLTLPEHAITSTPVRARPRRLRARWSVESADDWLRSFGVEPELSDYDVAAC